jgi:hypothetical protein
MIFLTSLFCLKKDDEPVCQTLTSEKAATVDNVENKIKKKTSISSSSFCARFE